MNNDFLNLMWLYLCENIFLFLVIELLVKLLHTTYTYSVYTADRLNKL